MPVQPGEQTYRFRISRSAANGISNGQQQPGDVGSTCGTTPNHGFDHIYLLLQRVDADEMVIADNQSSKPHTRFVSGKGKTPTKFFLRAT